MKMIYYPKSSLELFARSAGIPPRRDAWVILFIATLKPHSYEKNTGKLLCYRRK